LKSCYFIFPYFYADVKNIQIFTTGELLVYPGSIVHLDCLYRRKLGNPEWIQETNNGKSYPTGNKN
jgi:hypothetical protein